MAAYSTYTDQELTALLRDGDEAAYSEVYLRYWKKIFTVAHKRLGDQRDAEEIVQDIFVNLWRKREGLKPDTVYAHYFAVAVKFEILDVMRKRSRVHAYEAELAFTFTEADEKALRDMDLYELQEQLQLAIRALPEKCQLVFRLKYEEDYSQRQIAEELNISEKTVEAHLAKGRKDLKDQFGKMLNLMLFFYF